MPDIPQGLQVFPGHHDIDQSPFGDLKGNLLCRDPVQGQQCAP